MAKRKMPDAEYIRQCLDYDPETGILTWEKRPPSHFPATKRRTPEHHANLWNSKFSGKIAGCLDTQGYWSLTLDSTYRSGHIIAWVITTGVWPNEEVDHKNNQRDDNRWDNLREASHGQNQQNAKKYSNNKSGFKGVCWHSASQKWGATFQVNGKQRWLGVFETPEEAYKVYCDAIRKAHGEFFNPG